MKKIYEVTTPKSDSAFAMGGMMALLMQHIVVPILMLFGFNPVHRFVNSKETWLFRSFCVSVVLDNRASPLFSAMKHWRDEGIVTLKDCHYDFSLMMRIIVAASIADEAMRNRRMVIINSDLVVMIVDPDSVNNYASDFTRLTDYVEQEAKRATTEDNLQTTGREYPAPVAV